MFTDGSPREYTGVQWVPGGRPHTCRHTAWRHLRTHVTGAVDEIKLADLMSFCCIDIFLRKSH